AQHRTGLFRHMNAQNHLWLLCAVLRTLALPEPVNKAIKPAQHQVNPPHRRASIGGIGTIKPGSLDDQSQAPGLLPILMGGYPYAPDVPTPKPHDFASIRSIHSLPMDSRRLESVSWRYAL